MIFGYIRETHGDLPVNEQKKRLSQKQCDQIITEVDANRSRFHQLVQQLNKGDKIVVVRLSLLADSIHHLEELFDVFKDKEADLCSIEEKIDTSETEKYSLDEIVRSLANFQSDLISEKTRKGMDQAKTRGVVTGRPRKPDANIRRAIELYESRQYSLKEIKEKTGISKSTLYRYLDK